MVDRAGCDVEADADVGREDVVLAHVVEAICAQRPVRRRVRVGQDIVLLAAAAAEGRPDGQVVIDVELAADDAEQLFLVGIGPGLGEVDVGGRRGRNRAVRGDRRTRRVNAVVLPAEVGREPGAVAAAVDAEAQHLQFAVLAVDRGLAVAGGEVQTAAPFAVFSEAAREVAGGVQGVAAVPTQGQAVERQAARPLRRQVDGAAHVRAAGRRTVQEGGRAVEDLDPFDQLGRHELARQDAIQAVPGHVVGIDREAAHNVQLLEVSEALGDPHHRIVLQHVADAAGLLVPGQLLCVAGEGERRGHHVLRTEHPDAAARRDLSAGIGRRLTHLRAGDDHLGQFGGPGLLRHGGTSQNDGGGGGEKKGRAEVHGCRLGEVRLRTGRTISRSGG